MSVEFLDVRTVKRKAVLGNSIEAVCGHVKGRERAGKDAERPFIYLVNDDEAYIVDEKSDSVATISYRNICTDALPRAKDQRTTAHP